MAKIFEGLLFVLDSSSFTFVPFKKKQKLRDQITNNGGSISYVLTQKCDLVLTADAEKTLSSYKGATAAKYGIPVVNMEYINDCFNAEAYLDPFPYICSGDDKKQLSSGKINANTSSKGSPHKRKIHTNAVKVDLNKISVFPYKDTSSPPFPEKDYKIVKDMIFQKLDSDAKISQFFAMELHAVPSNIQCHSQRFRVFTHHGHLDKLKCHHEEQSQAIKECYYSYTAEEAMGIYIALYDRVTSSTYQYTRAMSHLSVKIGSDKMRERYIDEQGIDGGTPPILEVASLVDYLWKEAIGCLSETLAIPVENIKLQNVQEAEGILMKMKDCLDNKEQFEELWKEFCKLMPHEDKIVHFDKSFIAEKQNLCQMVKDIVTVSEATNMSTTSSQLAKYRALRCHIEYLDHDDSEFKKIKEYTLSSQKCSELFEIISIYSLHRPVEDSNFTHHIDNKRLLFHASVVSNFVGILSRGLLLPKIVVDDFGGKRSDAGMLGSGIYFADSISTSAEYSTRGSMGSRFMLINEVALGKVMRNRQLNKDLTGPPQGFNSVQGVAKTPQDPSDFKANEFVIYNTSQQQMRYLVEFCFNSEYSRKRHLDFALLKELEAPVDPEVQPNDGPDIDLYDVTSAVNPLSKVQAGLKGSTGTPIPLQAVHVRAKLLDLVTQVVVLQSYKNNSSVSIEAKYVFPLDDMAAVCGFEAFINGKHIVGEVKEKQQAHREYQEAISQGHGAYLMDEETPDVFTVSVGNLPPNAQVLIKITYVAELTVERDNICFRLPGSIAPWKHSHALNQETQTEVDTVKVKEQKNTTIQVAIEMPFVIRSIESPTHPILIKRTATKAVVEMENGHVIGDSFQLVVQLAEIHVPRMWVESHETRHDSQAAMLVFYPEFEAEPPTQVEVVFLLDASCSMKGSSLQEAKKILMMCLIFMPEDWLFNIIVFGSFHCELFPDSQKKTTKTLSQATEFIKTVTAQHGSTDLWRTLESLHLIPSMAATDHPRNILLISDGHVTEETTTLEYIRSHRLKIRIFSLGVGDTSNRHLLRSLAHVGAGACEFFDSKCKSKWIRKVKGQISKCEQPNLMSVSVVWQQHDSNATPPVQAPNEIMSLFSGNRLVVYGFVSNCTQASLKAEVNGRPVSTVVSTSELSITRGKILHQLVARSMIGDWEEGNLDPDHTRHEVVKRDRKDYIIALSKEFSIVSQFTSFVAIEKRDKDETFEENAGPSILELVANENVDIIPYVGWEEKENKISEGKLKLDADEGLLHFLVKAKMFEGISVVQAEDLYKEACQIVSKDWIESAHETVPSPTTPAFLKAYINLSKFYLEVMHDNHKCVTTFKSMLSMSGCSDDYEAFKHLLDDKELEEFATKLFQSEEFGNYHLTRKSFQAVFPSLPCDWLESDSVSTSTETSESSWGSDFSESGEEESKKWSRQMLGMANRISAVPVKYSFSSSKENTSDLCTADSDVLYLQPSQIALPFSPEEDIYEDMCEDMAVNTEMLDTAYGHSEPLFMLPSEKMPREMFICAPEEDGDSHFDDCMRFGGEVYESMSPMYEATEANTKGGMNMDIADEKQCSDSDIDEEIEEEMIAASYARPPPCPPGGHKVPRSSSIPSPPSRVGLFSLGHRPTPAARKCAPPPPPPCRHSSVPPPPPRVGLFGLDHRPTPAAGIPAPLPPPPPPPAVPLASSSPARSFPRARNQVVIKPKYQTSLCDVVGKAIKPVRPNVCTTLDTLFKGQHPDGYWDMDDNVFLAVGFHSERCVALLKELGASSLGDDVFYQILKLIATMLMLALLRIHFPNLFPISLDPHGRKAASAVAKQWREQILKALHWARCVDRKIPSVCFRLELGSNWDQASDWLIQKCQ